MSSVITGAVPADSKKQFERWFFTFVAAEFLLIVIVGFAPNSLAIIHGTKANPPLIVHTHAALMFSWMFAFLAQACLISAGKVSQHIQAGRVLFWVGLLVALSFVYLSLFRPGDGFGRIQIPMAAERIGLFSLFLTLAFFNRSRDSESHKRFIMLAALVPVDAGLNRMPWLPTFGIGWGTPIWMLILLGQLFAFDWYRLGRLHKATVFGGVLVAMFWIGMAIWAAFFR